MREILFKAKERYVDRWIEGMLIKDAAGNPRLTVVDSSGKGLNFDFIDPETLSQKTPVKNLWEGDIFMRKDNGDRCIVVWEKAGFQARLIYNSHTGKDGNGFTTSLYLWEGIEIEKLGNRFDNPELLNLKG